SLINREGTPPRIRDFASRGRSLHCETGVLARLFAVASSVKGSGRGGPFYIVAAKADDFSNSEPQTPNAQGLPLGADFSRDFDHLLAQEISATYDLRLTPETMTNQLNAANLNLLGPNIQVPKYDRQKVGQSIMHVGVGGFHRAHQALYTDDLLGQGGDPIWGYCGVGLLKHDARIRDVMLSQNCLYTLVERSLEGDRARIVGSIVNFLFAPDDAEKVIEQMASPQTRIVSLTITEGGYYIDASTGELDDKHPDIQYDLAHPHEPRCSFGYLLEALDRRRLRGISPFTLMSCDNIQSNGEVAKKMLMAFAELRDPVLRNWMAEKCPFPNSMVDRITPATTDEHRTLVKEKFGIEDGWPVMTESFKQWVIEDHFPLGRPAWESVGAQMTTDVLPYEKMKLRLLNASHQALCYIGMLLGYQLVHETMEDQDIRKLVEKMMDE